MAFIRNRNNTGSDMFSEGSNVAGQSALAIGGNPKTSKVRGPQSWYNITEFLKANESAIPQYQDKLRAKADRDIQTAQTGAQAGMQGMSNIQRPDAINYSDEEAWEDPNKAQEGIGQWWDTSDYSNFSFNQPTNIINLKPSDRSSLIDYSREDAQKKGTYTEGMRGLNDFIYGQDPDFVKNFATDTVNKYNTQVANPYQEAYEASQAKDADKLSELDTARQGWFTGLRGLLDDKYALVSDTAAKQRADEDAVRTKIADASEIVKKNIISDPNKFNKYGNYSVEDFFKTTNPNSYLTTSGGGTDMSAAAMASLGNEGIGKYNSLANILSGATNKPVMNLTGREYNPFTVGVEGKKASEGYDRYRAGKEYQAAEDDIRSLKTNTAFADKEIQKLESILSDKKYQDFPLPEDNGWFAGATDLPLVVRNPQLAQERDEYKRKLQSQRDRLAGLNTRLDDTNRYFSTLKGFIG